MSNTVSRREFLGQSAAVAAATAGVVGTAGAVQNAPSSPSAGQLKKALLWAMLPSKISIADRFKLTADLGFDGIEGQTVTDERIVDEMRTAAEKTGIPIHSVMNMGHWQNPLSSANREVVEKSVEGLKTSIRNAKAWGADAVLLVPAVVNPETRYQDAYARSRKVIREEVLPFAREAGVVIAIENVWNKFLLSPLEFARYIDEFNDPYLQAYFDIGNNVLYGYPEDWILTLGKRTKKLHLKDFKRANMGSNPWVQLRDGDVNWPAVRKAIAEVNFSGFLTAELPAGDEAYLREVAQRIDLILEGK